MDKKNIALIPAAGRGNRMLNLTDDCPKAMLPLRNKPIIGWHLDKLINEGIEEVCIVVGYKKEKLIDYVNGIYADKLNITYVEQTSLDGLADAIKCGLDALEKTYDLNKYNLLIILGDTIINDELTSKMNQGDFVGYKLVSDYSRWCLMKTQNNIITEFIDKPDNDPKTRKAVIGIYYFTNIIYLKACIDKIIKNNIRIKNEFQLSSAMEIYMETINLFAIEFKEWFDCGEVDSFNKTRKNITRHFNSIEITDDNTIIKRSDNENKINQEINWYLNLPNKLRVYVPQLIDYSMLKNNVFYELEYINFSPMQELFLYNLPSNEDWEKFFNNIFHMIERFKLYSTKARFNSKEHVNEILINKTEKRIEDIKKNDYFYSLMNYSSITINNNVYKNFKLIWPEIKKYVEDNILQNTSQYWQIIHGDLFFGNILYDVNSETLKILDPRGNFGIDGVYGDIRYDIAKLMHSIIGRYDFIINDLFAIIQEKDNIVEYILYDSPKHLEIESIFNSIVEKNGYNIEEILVITGLLFISMIPLHSENINHQKMFYYIGIQILNKVF